jgi:hypothetical protein
MAEQIKFGDKLFLKGETLILDNGTSNGAIKSKNGTLEIVGNLVVTGDTTTVNSVQTSFADPTILLNGDFVTGTPTEDVGIEISRGTSANKLLTWSESVDKWTVNGETFVAGTFEGNITGDITGNVVSSGVSTFASIDINGGNIDGTVIGTTIPEVGTFTTITGTTINGPVTGTVSSIANHSTSDLSEGTNLYYTDARVDSRYATLHSSANAGTLDGFDSPYFLDYNNFTNTPASGVTYTAGSGISLTGSVFANTSPDQTVALTGVGATSITGTYPNFTITSTDTNTNTTYTAGTNVSISVGNVISSTDTITDITGSIVPATDNTYDLGSTTKKYANVYGHSIEATFADLAERYATDVPYEVGTVVVFGGEAEITLTVTAGDVSVAGVISTNPAIKLNAEAGNSQTHPYVALRGRVPCMLVGPVSKGDLIVTADNEPGYAQSIGKNDAGHSVFAKSITTDLSVGKKVIEVVIL